MKRICEDFNNLVKKYGDQVATEFVARINELESAESLFDIYKIPQARCHKLTQDLKRFHSVDIIHPLRILLLPLNGSNSDTKTITEVQIHHIKDPH